MRKRKIYAAVGLLALVACADPTGPLPPGDEVCDEVAVLGRVAGSNSGDVESHILQHAEGAPSLEVYKLSFWATRGRSRRVRIRYAEPGSGDDPDHQHARWNSEDDTFLSLYIPRFALETHPDGRPIARGERVFITITVDPEKLLVSFEPYGLVFNRWSRPSLYLSYNTAGGDYDGDGDVDSVDSYVEENYLRLWERTPQSSESAGVDFQAQARGNPWSPGDADKSTKRNTFGSCVAKLTDVAVSW